jgi:hypothetical protein
MECDIGCKCPNQTGATSLGFGFGNYDLNGRISHNKFNILLGLI